MEDAETTGAGQPVVVFAPAQPTSSSARQSSSSAASPKGSRLERTVPLNMTGSCGMMAMPARTCNAGKAQNTPVGGLDKHGLASRDKHVLAWSVCHEGWQRN